MIDEKKLIDELKQNGMIADNDYGNSMVDMIENQPKIGGLLPIGKNFCCCCGQALDWDGITDNSELTDRLRDGAVIQRTELEGSSYEKCMDRLAEYEDLGVTPEQLRQIDGMYADRCREIAELRKMLGKAAGGRLQ